MSIPHLTSRIPTLITQMISTFLVIAVSLSLFTSSPAAAIAQPTPAVMSTTSIPKEDPPTSHAAMGTMDAVNTPSAAGVCANGFCYYWATMIDSGFTATGASATITQAKPIVNAHDYHSLAELAVESADDQQIIEIGWIVAPDVNHDSLAHLFVYHWVNGQSTCYNGCGFVATSTKVTAGSLVKTNTTGTYAIKYSKSEWILTYNGAELGYFPESLWGGAFTSAGAVQAFGEVVSSSATSPKTQMGNGIIGTSTKAARISAFTLMGANVKPRLIYSADQAPSVYKIGNYSTTCTSSCTMTFGGPGY